MPDVLAPLDWICVAVLLVSLLVGAWRGLVVEVLSVASWLAAFVLAQWFAPDVAAKLPMAGAAEPVRYAAGFVLVFVARLDGCALGHRRFGNFEAVAAARVRKIFTYYLSN